MVIINAVKIISERMNRYWNLLFECQLNIFLKGKKDRKKEAEERKAKRKKRNN